MGRITSGIGLSSGFPIQDTVDQLMELSARPRDLLVERREAAQAEQTALGELAGLLFTLQFSVGQLEDDALFDERSITSSNPDALSAQVTGEPPLGTFQFTPVRKVQAHQLVSSPLSSATDPLGGGSLSFRFGAHVERPLDLSLTNGGSGFVRGKIRIIDRSGATGIVDLSTAQDIDDVLAAINGQTAVNVEAQAHGDAIRLIDRTGQSVSNLKVQEVSGGTTAASLGLAGIDAASDTADGEDIVRLFAELGLDQLNDGNGVRADNELDDLEITFRDGTSLTADFNPADGEQAQTLGEALDFFNSLDPARLKAEFAPDGDRLLLTDLTADNGGQFAVTELNGSHLAEDLGIDIAASGDTISGRRLLAGTRTVLLDSLNGTAGIGSLGLLDLQDRSGATDQVDLSGAETLEDVIEAINAAGVAIEARVNDARNGLVLTDTSGASGFNLRVSSTDSTADALGVAVDDAVSSINSGDLHLQVVGEATKLADLNGGAGVALGTIEILDSNGLGLEVDLADEGVETVGDLLRAINRLPFDVEARINDTGDGLLLIDHAGGAGTLRVAEVGSTTAADLHLLGDSEEVDIDGATRQVIDGATTFTLDVAAEDTLEDVVAAVNDLGAGVTATIFNDGSAVNPFRVSLVSEHAGKLGEVIVDASDLGINFQETAAAKDALLLFGAPDSGSSGILVSSPSNSFDGVLPGATLNIGQTSNSPVSLTVSRSDSKAAKRVQTLVDDYNSLRSKLSELTAFDPLTGKGGVLQGDSTALRLETDLSRLLSGSFFGVSSISSLESVGIGINDDGTLSFDSAKFQQQFAEDPEAVKQFFTAADVGFVAKLDGLLGQMAGEDSSLLDIRLNTIESHVEDFNERIEFLNERLERERESLLRQFFNMELIIGRMQSSLSAIEAIQPLQPLAPRRSNRN